MSSITKSMAEKSSKTLKNGGDSPPDPPRRDSFFFPRLSTKENSNPKGDGSFRVLYYGGAGSVPFTWESRPGTPKQTFDDRPLTPPLTPPPSYQFSPQATPSRKKHHLPRSSKICKSIFSKNSSKKSDVVPTFSPSSSQSSSYSLPSPPPFKMAPSPSVARLGLGHDEPETDMCSPSSTLCFGQRTNGNSRIFWDYHDPIKNVKKMVLSIVGHAKNN